MKILGIREGFTADHSSTSYQFYAVDRPLNKKERSQAAGFSRRAYADSSGVSYTYNVDGYDLPWGAQEELLDQYFDVMVCEDYDWWTFAMSFKHTKKLLDAPQKYECDGPNDTGISVKKSKKIVLSIHCRLDCSVAYDCAEDERYDDEYDEEDEEAERADYEEYKITRRCDFFAVYIVMLVDLRKSILAGDYAELAAVAAAFEPERFKKEAEDASGGGSGLSVMIDSE